MQSLKPKVLEMKALLERGWCQGASARDGDGLIVSILDERAVQYCLVGAMDKVCESNITSPEVTTLHDLIFESIEDPNPNEYEHIPDYNDRPNRTKEEVLALLDKVVEVIDKGESVLR